MEEENRRRGQLGLAMLGLTLAVAVLLSAWSAATGGSARGASTERVGAQPPTQVANRVGPGGQALAAGGDTGAALVGFPCTGTACDVCEQNGGNCTPIDDKPGRCTCP
ncbi:MAG TPA: hypothetical protein VHW23_00225 [Kofleriaceae bacterium]|jgi:hypothetical protein|nr:hypothetical protein [Kofleriaceae bacterium]